MNTKIKNIKIEITLDSGMTVGSTYVHPKFRMKDLPNSPFKKMEKSPIKWATEMIKKASK